MDCAVVSTRGRLYCVNIYTLYVLSFKPPRQLVIGCADCYELSPAILPVPDYGSRTKVTNEGPFATSRATLPILLSPHRFYGFKCEHRCHQWTGSSSPLFEIQKFRALSTSVVSKAMSPGPSRCTSLFASPALKHLSTASSLQRNSVGYSIPLPTTYLRSWSVDC